MTTTSAPNRSLEIKVPEQAIQASYGVGIVGKTYRLQQALRHIASDIEILSSFNNEVFIQLQAYISIFGAQTPSSTSLPQGETAYTKFKDCAKFLDKHPLTQFFRIILFWKQTSDFAVASVQWLSGNRENRSMAYQLLNTSLSYIPLLIAKAAEEKFTNLQISLNIMMLACLAYSLRRDMTLSADSKERETSPTMGLIKKYLMPPVVKYACITTAIISHKIKNLSISNYLKFS